MSGIDYAMVRSVSVYEFPEARPEFLDARAEDDKRLAERVNDQELKRLAIEYLSWSRAMGKKFDGKMYEYHNLMRRYTEAEARLEYPNIDPLTQVELEDLLEKLEEVRKRLLEEIKSIALQVVYRNDHYIQKSERVRERIASELGLSFDGVK